MMRPKDVQDAVEDIMSILNLTDPILKKVCNRVADGYESFQPLPAPTSLLGDVMSDVGLQDDGQTLLHFQEGCRSHGGRRVVRNILQKPMSCPELLWKRQCSIDQMRGRLSAELQVLHECESDMLWSLHLHNIPDKDAWTIDLVFPSYPCIRLINRSSTCLGAYHLYRILVAPSMSVASPIATLFGPYFFLKRNLGIQMTLSGYIKYGSRACWHAMQWGNLPVHMEMTKYIVISLYIFLFIYNTVVSLDVALISHRMRRTLKERSLSLERMIDAADRIMRRLTGTLDGFITNEGMSCIQQSIGALRKKRGFPLLYSVWKRGDVREDLKTVCRFLYIIDALCSIPLGLPRTRVLKGAEARRIASRFYGMSHPCLPDAQVRNDACFRRNLIITGPNAAGKSTYARTVLLNIVLSQTLGLCSATRGIITPFHAISSAMRLQDTTGSESLFEAEVKRCRQSLETIADFRSRGLTSIHFLDEPLHSTPPLEGASTAMAYIKLLASDPLVKVCATTHYHCIALLEKEEPALFRNVSMSAQNSDKEGGVARQFTFPYRIQRGPCFQCIALELLPNSELTESAIKYKNLFCQGVL